MLDLVFNSMERLLDSWYAFFEVLCVFTQFLVFYYELTIFAQRLIIDHPLSIARVVINDYTQLVEYFYVLISRKTVTSMSKATCALPVFLFDAIIHRICKWHLFLHVEQWLT